MAISLKIFGKCRVSGDNPSGKSKVHMFVEDIILSVVRAQRLGSDFLEFVHNV